MQKTSAQRVGNSQGPADFALSFENRSRDRQITQITQSTLSLLRSTSSVSWRRDLAQTTLIESVRKTEATEQTVIKALSDLAERLKQHHDKGIVATPLQRNTRSLDARKANDFAAFGKVARVAVQQFKKNHSVDDQGLEYLTAIELWANRGQYDGHTLNEKWLSDTVDALAKISRAKLTFDLAKQLPAGLKPIEISGLLEKIQEAETGHHKRNGKVSPPILSFTKVSENTTYIHLRRDTEQKIRQGAAKQLRFALSVNLKENSIERVAALKIGNSKRLVVDNEYAVKQSTKEFNTSKELDGEYVASYRHMSSWKSKNSNGEKNRAYLFQTLATGDGMDFAKGNLSRVNRLKMLHEASQGLAYIHEHEYIHRDFKPENLLWFSDHGVPSFKITDFGYTVKKTDPQHFICGTKAYLPQDFLTNTINTRKQLPADDVYAWGKTAELLNNKIFSVRRSDRELQKLIRKTTDGTPSMRPTAEEVAQSMSEILQMRGE